MMQQCRHPRGGYNERFRFEEVVQEDIILDDDCNNSSGGMQMKPSAHWSSQPKHGDDNHYGHVNGLHKDGYRAQFSEDYYNNEGYNGAWNEKHGHGHEHGAYKYQSSQPKHGYDNHYGHVNGLHKDGYRAKFSEDYYNNEGYNGTWNEKHGHGNEHGAYKYQSGIPHDAIKYAGYGGQHQHQYQHQHHGE